MLAAACIVCASAMAQKPDENLRFDGHTTTQKSSEDNPKTLSQLVDKAEALFNEGQYPQAELLFKSALSILERASNPHDHDVVFVLTGLANTYRPQDRYAEAEPLLIRALTIQEKLLGKDHAEVATSLNNLAYNYEEQGQYAKAEPLFKRALTILEKSPKSNEADIASSVSALARLYRLQGLYTEAEPLYVRALTIQERVLGADHPQIALDLELFAELYYAQARYEEGKPLIMRALTIWRKTFSNTRPDLTLNSMNRLALLLARRVNDAELEPLLKQIAATAEKTLGPNHPIVATSLRQLASLYHARGQDEQAEPLLTRATDITHLQLMQVLIGWGERERLNWQRQNLSFDLPAALFQPQAMADYILHFKGVVLDSLVQDRKLAANDSSGEGRKKLDELLSLRGQLSKIELDSNPASQRTATDIKDKIARLEGAMGKTKFDVDNTGGRASLSVQEVLPLIPADTVLIDFVAYKDHKPDNKLQACYGFSALSPSGGVHWTKIEKGEQIERAVTEYRNALSEGNEKALRENLRLLYDTLWLPIEAVLPPKTKAVIISPDSILNFLSFACLLDEAEHFVSEKYSICYVGSGRDLVPQDTKKKANSFVAFADPLFDSSLPGSNLLSPRSRDMAEYAGVTLPRLPGTDVEARQIKGLADAKHWSTQFASGPEATEIAVKSAKGPTILHLATHGFYLANGKVEKKDGGRGMHIVGTDVSSDAQQVAIGNPMRLSGVAFAGAQNTLRAWAEGKAPDASNDGILTAEEVATLDLQSTWLVTLSACSTGVGEARSGEGVFGLRRAFMMAGARNLLMTLWPVADDSTAELMADFYKRAFETGDASRALAETQRQWLLKLRKEKGLLMSVRDAGPFVMATTDLSLLPERYEEMLSKAEKGEAAAQLALGMMYQEGRSIGKDYPEAFKWYKMAAEQNDARAQSALGAMLFGGQGLKENGTEAMNWFRKAAEQNDPRGQNGLGLCYYMGTAVKKDEVEAAKWFRKAAEQDYAKSQYFLGVMYSQGEGVQKDESEGIRWLRRSAEQKFALAQFAMGVRYIDGAGVPKSANEAMHWFWLAACQKHGDALYNLSAMRKGRSYEYALMRAAKENGSKNASKALAEIEAQLTTKEKKEAEQITASVSEELNRINNWIQMLTARGGR
jgi:TPR repeat protein